jgi:uncharacterized membrane protein YphA (DoxX/SURF4 family)
VTIDPVPVLVAGLAVAWLFAHAAWHKARALQDFAATLTRYRVLPAPLVPVVAPLLVAIEIAIAAGALAGVPAAFVAAGALLALYGCAIAVSLVRDGGLHDCGCGGPPQPISWWLVGRNLVLAIVAAVPLLPVTERGLGMFDVVTVCAALLALAGLYAAMNALHAARARMEEWV